MQRPGRVAVENGAHGRTRTCNHRLRRTMLYPVELRARNVWRVEWDSNPRWLLTTPVFKTGALSLSAIYPAKTCEWCWLGDSNPRPTAYKAVALPTELSQHEMERVTGLEPATGSLEGY